MGASQDDRRAAERHEAVVVVQLDEAGRHGVTRDVSEKGLLIATRSEFAVGDRLEITVHANNGPFKAKARVVRVEETPPEEPWRFRIALELDEPLPHEVAEDGARAAATLLRHSNSRPPPSSKE